VAQQICGICGQVHSCAYCEAVEEACGIKTPMRAKYIRSILLELERLHSHLLWVGLAVPLLLQSWNSLHFYHEAFRPVRLSGSVVLLPGLVGMPFRLNFPVLGLAYLMATNVAFSIWFFFLLGLLEWLLFARLGVSISGGGDIWTSGGYSLPCSYQMAGGMLALALSVLWTARPHLRRLGRLAWRGQAAPGEILSPRLAFGSVLGGSVFLLAWLWFTGMSFYVAVLLVVGALLAFIGLSRVVCEAGLPGAQVPMVPQAFITRGLGPEVLGLRNMTCLGFSTVWMGETAANMMNAVVHSLKLSSWEGRPSRRMPWAILLAIAVVGTLGPGHVNAMLAIGVVNLPVFARLTRASVLAVREEGYVEAAQAVGGSDLHILWRHILPNGLAPLLVQASVSFATAILAEASLSYLGLGTQPPLPSWGRMLEEARLFMDRGPWLAVFPGLALALTVLGFNFLGDGLRDYLDPRH